MPRISFVISQELVGRIPELGPRTVTLMQELEAHAESAGVLPPKDSEQAWDAYSFTLADQGTILSRRILQEQGYQLIENDTQKFVWVGDELEMTETLANGNVDVQRFRQAMGSLYIATTIEDWKDWPVEGEFIVKAVILTD